MQDVAQAAPSAKITIQNVIQILFVDRFFIQVYNSLCRIAFAYQLI
jgi:hypothetical protein